MPLSAANVSNHLVWEATRSTNSYILKKSNGPYQFTKEPFNPSNTNSFKFSSIAQQGKILSVEREGEYDAAIITSSAEEFAEYKPKSLLKKKVLKDAGGPTRNNKKIIEAVEKSFYRRDLKDIVLNRYTKLYKAAHKSRRSRASN